MSLSLLTELHPIYVHTQFTLPFDPNYVLGVILHYGRYLPALNET